MNCYCELNLAAQIYKLFWDSYFTLGDELEIR